MKTILCLKWGDKYNGYEQKLYDTVKDQCDRFYCVTDNPTNEYDIKLPSVWPTHDCFTVEKAYLWKEDLLEVEGDEFIFFDLDVLIHNSIEPLWNLDMEKPYLVEGRWQNPLYLKKNYGKNGQGTKWNSSLVRWNRGQCEPIFDQLNKHFDYLTYTYYSFDNYLIHKWYNVIKDEGFFQGFPEGVAYSWYKGNIFPHDMETKKFRDDHIICMFNNSEWIDEEEEMTDIEELKPVWSL